MAQATAFSHCQLPPWHIADEDFQLHPQALELDNVLHTERRLWRALESIDEPADRARHFHEYISVKFGLHHSGDAELSAYSRAALQRSYVLCLRHWGVESDGPSGAALKAWVESRFGLKATYHQGQLATQEEARERYLRDRLHGAARAIGLQQQLDLLYTFAQLELRRQHPGTSWLRLYRGTHDAETYRVHAETEATPEVARRFGGELVEFNNLSSFTDDREVAWEFGSSVWKVEVPLAKILCFPGLLPPEMLQGEAEYLVLGGRYWVSPLRY